MVTLTCGQYDGGSERENMVQVSQQNLIVKPVFYLFDWDGA